MKHWHGSSGLARRLGKVPLLWLLALGAGGSIGACSSEPPGQSAEGLGTVGLNLAAGPDVTVNTVTYTITGNGFTKTGSIDASGSASVNATIGGIPAGNGYTIQLSATALDGGSTCGGSATFDVEARATTTVSIHLRCTVSPRTGSVLVNGTINVCPVVHELTATPVETEIGKTVTLIGSASDTDGAPSELTYSWSTSGGDLSDTSEASTRLTGGTPGTYTVTLTVSDGDCSETASVPITFTPVADAFAGSKLFADTVHYTELGEHRTATTTDHRTTEWLAARLKSVGFSVDLLPFSTNQFYPTQTSVTVDGHTDLEAFPVWWPKPTSELGETGKLTADINQVSGKVYLFDNPSGTINRTVQNTILTAAANGAVGVVVVLTRSATPSQEIYGQNAQQQLSYETGADPGNGDQTAWPIPVVTVGRKDRPALQTAIDNQLDVKIKSTGVTEVDATSDVVIGTLDRGPADKTLVVSTPSSGWFDDAGERGTGVAVWLALAEWAAKETSGVKWVFMSSSGHELNFRGTHEYLNSDLIPPPKDVYLWTHLGADLITYNYTANADGVLVRTNQPVSQSVKYGTANTAIRDALRASFLPANPVAGALNITGLQNSIAGGDLFYAKYYGYSELLYFAGGNPTFHTRQDTPESTSPELLEPMGKLIKSTLQQIISDL